MACWFGISILTRPSALRGPGGWRTLIPPAVRRDLVAGAEMAAIFGDDALRHVPPGIDRDRGDLGVELRRRRAHARRRRRGGGQYPAVLDQSGGEGRDVDEDVAGAEAARHPAPALHVGADEVAARGVALRRSSASARFSPAYCGWVGSSESSAAPTPPPRVTWASSRCCAGRVERRIGHVPVDPAAAAHRAAAQIRDEAQEDRRRDLATAPRRRCRRAPRAAGPRHNPPESSPSWPICST